MSHLKFHICMWSVLISPCLISSSIYAWVPFSNEELLEHSALWSQDRILDKILLAQDVPALPATQLARPFWTSFFRDPIIQNRLCGNNIWNYTNSSVDLLRLFRNAHMHSGDNKFKEEHVLANNDGIIFLLRCVQDPLQRLLQSLDRWKRHGQLLLCNPLSSSKSIFSGERPPHVCLNAKAKTNELDVQLSAPTMDRRANNAADYNNGAFVVGKESNSNHTPNTQGDVNSQSVGNVLNGRGMNGVIQSNGGIPIPKNIVEQAVAHKNDIVGMDEEEAQGISKEWQFALVG
ncbi:hypothetical protein AXF42_Ash002267 [Apostasia shenzhenica]|uniref:Uncharacterized protein n=1 Tax=Apostasia shenzhenica TaxID=1088818 RepID=A0A2I0AN35_9ASPA|nr:hypothetical protein AXF42_Ash002267 [Apostasia shenzhenica]